MPVELLKELTFCVGRGSEPLCNVCWEVCVLCDLPGSARCCFERVCLQLCHLMSLPSAGSWFGNAETKRRYIGVMMLTLTPRYVL